MNESQFKTLMCGVDRRNYDTADKWGQPITKNKMKRTRSDSNSDSNDEQRNCKKRKLEDKQTPYFLMTTDDDNIMHFYEIDTTHKLFPIVINALKTNKIKEKDEYPSNEVALFSTMAEYGSFADGAYRHYDAEEDQEEAIKDFLGLENYDASDFQGFLKSEHEGVDLTMRQNLLSSHVVFLTSWYKF